MITRRRLASALACVLLCATVVLAPTLADARAGSIGRSRGGISHFSFGSRGSRTYDYNGSAPIQRSITPRQAPNSFDRRGTAAPFGRPSLAQRHPFMTGLAGGFIGSWIGSMLFPHWGGMGYGMGYGMGFGRVVGSLLSWLLIIGLVWMLIRLFRRRINPMTVPDAEAMRYSDAAQARPAFGGGGTAPGRDMTVTEADYQAFEAILKNVQGAWSAGDLATLRSYVTPEMLSYFAEQLAENQSQGVINHVEQVELIHGDVREAWDEGRLQYATAHLRWRAIDYTVRSDRRPDDPDGVVDGDPQRPSEAAELWTFARSPGGHWLLAAIQQV